MCECIAAPVALAGNVLLQAWLLCINRLSCLFNYTHTHTHNFHNWRPQFIRNNHTKFGITRAYTPQLITN